MSSDHVLARQCDCKHHRSIEQPQGTASTDYSRGEALAESLCRTQAELAGYRTLYDCAPSIYFTLDDRGVVVAINQYGADRLGYAAAELLQQPVFRLFHPDDQPQLVKQFHDFVQQGAATANPVATWECRQLSKDKTILWIKMTARLMMGSGTLPIVLLICEEITAQKQTEAHLRLLERAIAESCNSIVIVDATQPHYPVVYVNPNFEQSTGYSASEVMGRNCRFLQGNDTQQSALDDLRTALKAGQGCRVVLRNYRKDGSLFWNELHISPIHDLQGQVTHFVGVQKDVTDRYLTEVALRDSEEQFRQLAENIHEIFWIAEPEQQRLLYISPAYETMWGLNPADLHRNLFAWLRPVHPQDRTRVTQALEQCRRDGQNLDEEFRLVRPDGSIRWIWGRGFAVQNAQGKTYRLVGIGEDITARKQAEESLKQQANRERLLSAIAQRIRQSLDLDETLTTTVTEIQQFLQADRVLVYRCWPDGGGSVVTEAVVPGWPTVLNQTFPPEVLPVELQQQYSQGRIRAIANIEQAEISPCLMEFLHQFEVKAKLVVPILHGSTLWGLLIAHQCEQPRQWQSAEIELMQQLATQVAIAIQQAQLYQQVQQLNTNLETQVQERTAQLRQALDFEATLKRITDKVRDSLDEHQILQTVVQELGQTLNVSYCNTALYSDDLSAIAASHEYACPNLQVADLVLPFSQFPQIYRQLYQGECFQLCAQIPKSNTWASLLLCSIFDNDRALGDLLLLHHKEQAFDELELRLVQQVANHCAIAIRQARLHQAAQSQVRELEKLNQLKDDFLSTVSHELRSPVCNMKMALQMLAVANPEPSDRFTRYLKILDDECEREINLINDLLDLQRLEAGTQPCESGAIELSIWLGHLAEPFQERAQQRQQAFQLQIPDTLPLLISDPYNLERIIAELLNNACKYTPPGENIMLTAQTQAGVVQLKVCNSGIEIPKVELSRIFDKFYRVPHVDRWKQGGTGLGLALVRKLTELVGGQVWVESSDGQTCFTVELPLRQMPMAFSSSLG